MNHQNRIRTKKKLFPIIFVCSYCTLIISIYIICKITTKPSFLPKLISSDELSFYYNNKNSHNQKPIADKEINATTSNQKYQKADPLSSQSTHESNQAETILQESDKQAEFQEITKKAENIKDAFMHVWKNYHKIAWTYDYFDPLNGTPYNEFNASYLMAESLTTLLLMNETKEAESILQHINSKVRPTIRVIDPSQPEFEPLMRKAIFNTQTQQYELIIPSNTYGPFTKTSFFVPALIGSFLSAYDITNDQRYLIVADNTFSLLPQSNEEVFILDNLTAHPNRFTTSGSPTIKTHKLGSHQLEFLSLSKKSNRTQLIGRSMQFYYLLAMKTKSRGIFTNEINAFTGESINGNDYSLSVDGLSVYENLFKHHKLTRESSNITKTITTDFLNQIPKFIEKQIISNQISQNNQENKIRMDIRDSFLPGVLLDYGKETNNDTLCQIATDLMDSFLIFLNLNDKTKLPPLIISTPKENNSSSISIFIEDDSFEFAPELFESLYIFWKQTKDEKYRNIAWKLFEEFNKTCRTEFGFADLKKGKQQNKFNPLLLSATFKYLYLMFKENLINDYENWVFNHHGHPLHVWKESDNNFDKFLMQLPSMYDLNDIGHIDFI